MLGPLGVQVVAQNPVAQNPLERAEPAIIFSPLGVQVQ